MSTRPLLHRALGGLAVALVVGGAVTAQPTPTFAPRGKPAFVPSKPAATPDIQQAAGTKADGALPAAVPNVTVPATPGPLPATPVGMPCPDLATPADVNAACGDSSRACDALCGPPGRVWFGAEWLYWGTKGNNLPPLVTAAPPGTARNVAGTIGGPGTTTLIGNQTVNNDWRSGLRIYGGMWLDPAQRLGLEGDFFFLGKSTYNASAGSNGTDIITRPFTNNVVRNPDGTYTQVAPYQDTQLVSFPGILSGTASVRSTNEFVGFGTNFVRNLCCDPCNRLDLLIGYRFLYLKDTVTIDEDLTGISPNAGTRFQVHDSFRTRNYFNGGVLGLAYEHRFSHYYVNVRSTVALGNTHSVVDINGNTVITPPGGPSTSYTGGLLAQPSNIGTYTKDSFAVVPEVSLRLGVQVTPHLRVYGGYNFIYWSSVVRPADVIDLRVNASQIPPRTNQTGTLYPQYNPSTSDFWAHGVMIGAEFRY